MCQIVSQQCYTTLMLFPHSDSNSESKSIIIAEIVVPKEYSVKQDMKIYGVNSQDSSKAFRTGKINAFPTRFSGHYAITPNL